MNERLVGIAAVVAFLGVDRTTVARWVKTGRFPGPMWIGRRRAWPEETVRSWAASQTKPSQFNLPRPAAETKP